MLIFEKEGFLEIEDSQIEELYQSRDTVTLEVPGSAPFALRASFTRYKVDSTILAHAAFYCRPLKRALIFRADPTASEPVLQLLTELGFSPEKVNLNHSAALRQVVLRDIAGLANPAEAARQRKENAAILADLEATIRTQPADSEGAKRAAHKLNAERQLDKRAEVLRAALEVKWGGIDSATKELRELREQAEILNARLQQVIALAAEEQRQREQADMIRGAVEKRLQEVETELVAAETRTTAGLKKISSLEKKVKKQHDSLTEAAAAHKAAQAKDVTLTATVRQLKEENQRLDGDLKQTLMRVRSLEQQLARGASELEKLRKTHGQLSEAANADKRRAAELQAALDEAKAALATRPSDDREAGFLAERTALEEALATTRAATQQEHKAREKAEKELGKAHAHIADLERTVKQLRGKAPPAGIPDDRQQVDASRDRLEEVESQLEQERREKKKLSDALDHSVKKLITLEARLQENPSLPAPQVAPGPVAAPILVAAPAGNKLLPHEIRPAPSPGALFHPNWDLAGLPCRSFDQVLDAWGSVYNVQLALEGYATQYCSAFVVVLKEGTQKRIYLLFDLKKDKHLLVCVPGKLPRDEAALKKLLGDAQNYLKVSGYELEKILPTNIPSFLKGYLQP